MSKLNKTPKKLSMAESYQFIANHSDEWAERLQTKLDDLRAYSNALKAHASQGDVEQYREQCRDNFEALYHTWGGAGDLLNILALPMFEEWFKQYQTKLQQEQGGNNG